MSHQENNHDFEFIDKGEEIQHFLHLVEHRVEYPVGGPVIELCVVCFFSPELGKEEKSFIGWIKQITKNIHENQKALA